MGFSPPVEWRVEQKQGMVRVRLGRAGEGARELFPWTAGPGAQKNFDPECRESGPHTASATARAVPCSCAPPASAAAAPARRQGARWLAALRWRPRRARRRPPRVGQGAAAALFPLPPAVRSEDTKLSTNKQHSLSRPVSHEIVVEAEFRRNLNGFVPAEIGTSIEVSQVD